MCAMEHKGRWQAIRGSVKVISNQCVSDQFRPVKTA